MKQILFSILIIFISYCFSYSQEVVSVNQNENIVKTNNNDSIDYSSLGALDAKKYYKHTGPFAGSFATSMVFPPLGLLTSISISIPAPREYNLGIPYSKKELILNDSYYSGYIKKAHQKKTLMTFAGFATGTAFFVSALAMTGYISWK